MVHLCEVMKSLNRQCLSSSPSPPPFPPPQAPPHFFFHWAWKDFVLLYESWMTKCTVRTMLLCDINWLAEGILVKKQCLWVCVVLCVCVCCVCVCVYVCVCVWVRQGEKGEEESVLYACVFYFCICTCSAQLNMFHMEKHSRIRSLLLLLLLRTFLGVLVLAFHYHRPIPAYQPHNKKLCGFADWSSARWEEESRTPETLCHYHLDGGRRNSEEDAWRMTQCQCSMNERLWM